VTVKVVPTIAVLSGALSIGSWTYRFVAEYMRYEEILFYIVVPFATWGLFAGSLFLLENKRRVLRILAATLLAPTSVLWALSVLVGFYGLNIH